MKTTRRMIAARLRTLKQRQGKTRFAFERLMVMYAMLRFPEGHGPVNCTTLAKRFEVSTKTIYADLAFLRDRIGLPIYYDGSSFSYKTDPAQRLPWCVRANELPKMP